MRIKNFTAAAVHGFMDFDITFNDDLTFLTGINGSGKTTVVKGISALVTPSVLSLSYTVYQRMEVEINDVEIEGENKQIKIWSLKDEGKLVLGTSETDKDLVLSLFPSDVAEPAYRMEERELEYYHEMETEYASHPVMKLVRSLPSPMLLGIERRATDIFPTPESRHSVRYRIRHKNRSLFGGSLTASLREAIDLAERRFRKIQARQRQLTENLRKNMLLSSLKYEKSRGPEIKFQRPQTEDIEPTKKMVTETLQALGLSRDEFESDIDAFFNELEEISELLGTEEEFQKILESGDDEQRNTILRWAVNLPQFNRITRIVSFVEKYIQESRIANEPIDRYLSIVNKFLEDGNKKLCFDETGILSVSIRDSNPIQVTSLSSGESQIIVIITHLSFNPAAQLANVFIVDEPELSLHVRWQELFVGAVTEANPKLQVILATHSPSIILDDTEHCIDLSEGVL